MYGPWNRGFSQKSITKWQTKQILIKQLWCTGADPVGVGIALCVHNILWTSGWILTKFAWICNWNITKNCLNFDDLDLIFKVTAVKKKPWKFCETFLSAQYLWTSSWILTKFLWIDNSDKIKKTNKLKIQGGGHLFSLKTLQDERVKKWKLVSDYCAISFSVHVMAQSFSIMVWPTVFQAVLFCFQLWCWLSYSPVDQNVQCRFWTSTPICNNGNVQIHWWKSPHHKLQVARV